MGSLSPSEITCIGLEDDSSKMMSRDMAESILRICAAPGRDDRTYTSVPMLNAPNGKDLYVSLSAFG